MNVPVLVSIGALALMSFTAPAHTPTYLDDVEDPELFGAYVTLAHNIDGPLEHAVTRTAAAVVARGWTILAEYDVGVEAENCVFGGVVLVLHIPEYTERVLEHGTNAAFALPIRIAVVQDERGIHITAANPESLTRTIINETSFRDDARNIVDSLVDVVAMAFPDNVTREQFGQMRAKGHIDKTMGIIAGGPFADKVETIATVRLDNDATLGTLAQHVYDGLENLAGEWRWKTRPVYRLDLPEHDVAILGVTSDVIEGRSFEIVHHGGNQARRQMVCPGIDHAAAYPIEVVLVRENDEVQILLIDEMFRMKMYFEDAGRMKFAANMRMPGSIENEIRDKIEDSLQEFGY